MGDLSIPDLALTIEQVENQAQSKNDESLSTDLPLSDESISLGKLRFAEDEN